METSSSSAFETGKQNKTRDDLAISKERDDDAFVKLFCIVYVGM